MHFEDGNYWARSASRGLTSRRRLLRGAAIGGAGLAGAVLLGCAEEEEPPAPAAATPAGTSAPAGSPTPAVAAEQPKSGGTFITPQAGPLNEIMDPHKSLAQAWSQWVWIGDVALQRSRDGAELVPQLVESWEVPGDGTEMIFKVRQNVKWHNRPPVDGRQLDAEDIVYNLQRITGRLDPDNLARYQRRTTLTGLVDAEAVDSSTVRITFDRPRSTFLWGLSDGRNSIVPRDFEEKGGKWEDTATLVGTGPFVVEKWENEVSVIFRRNPDYWDPGVPYLDAVEYKWLPDRTTQMTSLAQGDVDMFSTPSAVERQTLEKLGRDLQVQVWPASVLWPHWRFHTHVKPFDDARVRRAIQRIPEYKQAGDTFYGEGLWRFTGPLASGYAEGYSSDEIAQWPGYNPATKDKDIAEAKQLMDAAGFPEGEFSWSLLVFSATSFHNEAAIRATDKLKTVWPKMDAKIEYPPDFATFNQRQSGREGWDALSYTILGQPDAVLEMESQYHTKGSRNYGQFSDAEVDSLIEQASGQLDFEERKETLRAVQDLLFEEHMPMLWLLVNLQENWYTPRMRGIHEIYGLETSFEVGQRGRKYLWIDK